MHRYIRALLQQVALQYKEPAITSRNPNRSLLDADAVQCQEFCAYTVLYSTVSRRMSTVGSSSGGYVTAVAKVKGFILKWVTVVYINHKFILVCESLTSISSVCLLRSHVSRGPP